MAVCHRRRDTASDVRTVNSVLFTSCTVRCSISFEVLISLAASDYSVIHVHVGCVLRVSVAISNVTAYKKQM